MIPAWVNQYIGLPFEQCNCWQLVCRVYREQLSIRLPFLDDRYENPYDKQAIAKLYQGELERVWLKTDCPTVFSAAVFRIQGQLWHVGIVVDKDTMLHTYDHINSALERFNNSVWQHRIEGFYNYVG